MHGVPGPSTWPGHTDAAAASASASLPLASAISIAPAPSTSSSHSKVPESFRQEDCQTLSSSGDSPRGLPEPASPHCTQGATPLQTGLDDSVTAEVSCRGPSLDGALPSLRTGGAIQAKTGEPGERGTESLPLCFGLHSGSASCGPGLGHVDAGEVDASRALYVVEEGEEGEEDEDEIGRREEKQDSSRRAHNVSGGWKDVVDARGSTAKATGKEGLNEDSEGAPKTCTQGFHEGDVLTDAPKDSGVSFLQETAQPRFVKKEESPRSGISSAGQGNGLASSGDLSTSGPLLQAGRQTAPSAVDESSGPNVRRVAEATAEQTGYLFSQGEDVRRGAESLQERTQTGRTREEEMHVRGGNDTIQTDERGSHVVPERIPGSPSGVFLSRATGTRTQARAALSTEPDVRLLGNESSDQQLLLTRQLAWQETARKASDPVLLGKSRGGVAQRRLFDPEVIHDRDNVRTERQRLDLDLASSHQRQSRTTDAKANVAKEDMEGLCPCRGMDIQGSAPRTAQAASGGARRECTKRQTSPADVDGGVTSELEMHRPVSSSVDAPSGCVGSHLLPDASFRSTAVGVPEYRDLLQQPVLSREEEATFFSLPETASAKAGERSLPVNNRDEALTALSSGDDGPTRRVSLGNSEEVTVSDSHSFSSPGSMGESSRALLESQLVPEGGSAAWGPQRRNRGQRREEDERSVESPPQKGPLSASRNHLLTPPSKLGSCPRVSVRLRPPNRDMTNTESSSLALRGPSEQSDSPGFPAFLESHISKPLALGPSDRTDILVSSPKRPPSCRCYSAPRSSSAPFPSQPFPAGPLSGRAVSINSSEVCGTHLSRERSLQPSPPTLSRWSTSCSTPTSQIASGSTQSSPHVAGVQPTIPTPPPPLRPVPRSGPPASVWVPASAFDGSIDSSSSPSVSREAGRGAARELDWLGESLRPGAGLPTNGSWQSPWTRSTQVPPAESPRLPPALRHRSAPPCPPASSGDSRSFQTSCSLTTPGSVTPSSADLEGCHPTAVSSSSSAREALPALCPSSSSSASSSSACSSNTWSGVLAFPSSATTRPRLRSSAFHHQPASPEARDDGHHVPEFTSRETRGGLPSETGSGSAAAYSLCGVGADWVSAHRKLCERSMSSQAAEQVMGGSKTITTAERQLYGQESSVRPTDFIFYGSEPGKGSALPVGPQVALLDEAQAGQVRRGPLVPGHLRDGLTRQRRHAPTPSAAGIESKKSSSARKHLQREIVPGASPASSYCHHSSLVTTSSSPPSMTGPLHPCMHDYCRRNSNVVTAEGGRLSSSSDSSSARARSAAALDTPLRKSDTRLSSRRLRSSEAASRERQSSGGISLRTQEETDISRTRIKVGYPWTPSERSADQLSSSGRRSFGTRYGRELARASADLSDASGASSFWSSSRSTGGVSPVDARRATRTVGFSKGDGAPPTAGVTSARRKRNTGEFTDGTKLRAAKPTRGGCCGSLGARSSSLKLCRYFTANSAVLGARSGDVFPGPVTLLAKDGLRESAEFPRHVDDTSDPCCLFRDPLQCVQTLRSVALCMRSCLLPNPVTFSSTLSLHSPPPPPGVPCLESFRPSDCSAPKLAGSSSVVVVPRERPLQATCALHRRRSQHGASGLGRDLCHGTQFVTGGSQAVRSRLLPIRPPLSCLVLLLASVLLLRSSPPRPHVSATDPASCAWHASGWRDSCPSLPSYHGASLAGQRRRQERKEGGRLDQEHGNASVSLRSRSSPFTHVDACQAKGMEGTCSPGDGVDNAESSCHDRGLVRCQNRTTSLPVSSLDACLRGTRDSCSSGEAPHGERRQTEDRISDTKGSGHPQDGTRNMEEKGRRRLEDDILLGFLSAGTRGRLFKRNVEPEGNVELWSCYTEQLSARPSVTTVQGVPAEAWEKDCLFFCCIFGALVVVSVCWVGYDPSGRFSSFHPVRSMRQSARETAPLVPSCRGPECKEKKNERPTAGKERGGFRSGDLVTKEEDVEGDVTGRSEEVRETDEGPARGSSKETWRYTRC